MLYVVIDGMKPYDGRYELGFIAELTTREWGFIKRHAGYMPLTVDEGLNGLDPELIAILAVIALRRAGRIDTPEVAGLYERLGDTPFGTTITLEGDDEPVEDDDARPPEASSNGKQPSSGGDSMTSSETSEPTPSHSGIPGSATSPSDPLTWAS